MLLDIMTDYLDHVRPVLAARAQPRSRALWLSDHARSYGGTHLATRIRQITKNYVGERVTPHMFRDYAATTLAYDSPESAKLTRALLGQTTFRFALVLAFVSEHEGEQHLAGRPAPNGQAARSATANPLPRVRRGFCWSLHRWRRYVFSGCGGRI